MTRQKFSINVDEWKKIATNIKTGIIDIVEYFDINNYLIDIKNTGAAAPINNGTGTLFTGRQMEILFSDSIDVYVKALNEPGKIVITR